MASEDTKPKEDSQTEGDNKAPEVAPEVIQEARSQGWVPLEEFRDNEDKWVDAETFVKRGREINPILRKHNQELKAQLARAEAKAQEAIDAAQEFRAFQKEAFERRKADLDAEIKLLKQAKRHAMSENDGPKVADIEADLEIREEEKQNLRPPPPPKRTADQQLDPALVEWIERNQWYGKDTEESQDRTELTNAMALSIRRKKPSLQGQAFLDELDREIDRKMPEWRKPAGRSAGSPVEGAGGRQGRPATGGKSYSDLPSDAKAACDRFVKQKLMTKEQYVKDYFNE